MKRLVCALIWMYWPLVMAEDLPLPDESAQDAQPEVLAEDGREADTEAEADTDVETAPVVTLAEEIELLEDVQAGLALALAACAEEAHCVTALNEQEMQHMRDELSELLTERELPADDPLRERYETLLREQVQMQQTIAVVTANIDRDELEGVWSDQFEIDEIVVGPQVPFPNEDITLSRFEDLNQPLPIE
ncbi:hypothetical protein BGP77_16685 [Saccharospirillum sp. MSK14-1]|uniref:hypothetical protein n=1 Tax=Saccharospirillum sp. MSK14-1 TaxID=1897632 RepID=UPI000D3A8FEB|nr:hypothetical protein [Saccharospirillum sp. MSK14-1]PTY38087.1 hypothetical protein BGP77_16685 [Saccharospirillum sp. MSK14-1]